MKKFFMMAVTAIAAIAFTNSCDSNYGPDSFLDEVTVSSSFVALPAEGGNATITVNAGGNWQITGVPEWLTVSPASGNAGETAVTFSATPASSTNEAVLKLVCDGATQLIKVLQMTQKVELPITTCAVINDKASPNGNTFRAKGVCTKIANDSYGNWYLQDETGEVYIYGTLDKAGAEKNFLSLGIEVGDIVTVEGPKSTYGDVVELVNVTVISIEKSLIKVDSVYVEGVKDAAIPTLGGDVEVFLTSKGNGVSIEIPESAKEWLSVTSLSSKGNNATVKLHASENVAGPRAVTLTFVTADGKKNYTSETSVTQLGAAGSLELPMTVAQAIEAANAGVTTPVYIKGIVSELVNGGYGAQYGNGSFWISADGTKADDLALDFEVYQANWLGGASWTEENAQIAVGAEVIVYGPLTTYKGTAETQGKGAAHVYSVNGVTTDANGIGSLENPFNVAGGIAAAVAAPSSKVYVAGIVSELVSGGFSAQYGNGSFWISEDGAKAGDLSLDFEAYQVNYLGGQKWTEENPQIEVGDNVVLYGPLTTYKGTSETQGKGAAYIYSLNGATE